MFEHSVVLEFMRYLSLARKLNDYRQGFIKSSEASVMLQIPMCSLLIQLKKVGNTNTRCMCIICSTEFSLPSDVCTGNALAEKLRCEDNQSHSAQTSGDQYQTDQECSQSYKELNQRRQRCKDLGRIVQKMTTKKQLMVRRFRRKPPGTMF